MCPAGNKVMGASSFREVIPNPPGLTGNVAWCWVLGMRRFCPLHVDNRMTLGVRSES